MINHKDALHLGCLQIHLVYLWMQNGGIDTRKGITKGVHRGNWLLCGMNVLQQG